MSARGRVGACWIAVVAVAACSAPAVNPELAGAERAERDGAHDRALALYQEAQRSCRSEEPERRRRQTCATAYLGHAELLEHMDRPREAAQAYERLPAALRDDPTTAAAGLYRAGTLYLELGEDERAYTLLWKTITDYPDEDYAADAMKRVLRDGRRRNPAQLYQVLADLLQPLARTRMGDNLLYNMADLAEHELADPRTALRLLDKLAGDYPRSGLRDDAWWQGARLARSLGDGRGAADRLRALLATREAGGGMGSYRSEWHDNAQLELGRVLRDDLGDGHAALAALAQLAEYHPKSALLDDTLWEIAVTWDRLGNRERTCAALDQLARMHAGSRYELTLAPELRRKHACTSAAG